MPPYNKGKGRGMEFLRENVNHQGDECLAWPLSCDTHGYGQVGIDGTLRKAYRVMCELAHGMPPTDKHEAAHSCGKGNQGCVNPKHLSWKTRSENQRDRRKHGSPIGQPYGRGGKLTPKEVVAIRHLKGVKPETAVGKLFGVSPTTINKIQNGKRWPNVR